MKIRPRSEKSLTLPQRMLEQAADPDVISMLRLADPGQTDHRLGPINASDFRRTPPADHPSAETFPAGDVDHRLAGWIVDQFH
jgi:hypothetical protein